MNKDKAIVRERRIPRNKTRVVTQHLKLRELRATEE